MGDRTWEQVERLRHWLDEETPALPGPADAEQQRRERIFLRVLKIGEEFGEVSEALHGATGANPRKGFSHTWQDVEKELVDVIVTSMIALATVTPEARERFEEGLDRLVDRVMPPQTDG